MTTTAPTQTAENLINNSLIDSKALNQKECWTNTQVQFATQAGPAFLQPGQYYPLWVRSRHGWRVRENIEIKTYSAYVYGGRYLVKGGGSKLSSHPTIKEWDGAPFTGARSALRYPGGYRSIKPGACPSIYANNENFILTEFSAYNFHSKFAKSSLLEGHALDIVVLAEHTGKTLPKWDATPVWDVMTHKTCCARILPLPVITSNEEEIVLNDKKFNNWQNAVIEFCDFFDLQEIGISIKIPPDLDDIKDYISNEAPKEVYRCAFEKGDLGYEVMDPGIYERMLPFQRGKLVKDLLIGL